MSLNNNTTLNSIRGTFKTILFVVTEGRENTDYKGTIKKKVMSVNNSLNERDVENLASLSPNSFEIERIHVAVFTTGRARTQFKKFKRDFEFVDEYENVEFTEELSKALSWRNNVYGYEFSGVYSFETGEKESFLGFISMLLSNKSRNVLMITDDKINYLRKSNIFDREVLDKFLIEEQTVIIQPFEYTEQIIKYVFIPMASPKTGSILITTYYSPLLRINAVKSKFRKVMRGKGGLKSKKGTNFVSFFDDNLEEFLAFLGEKIPEGLHGPVRKLYDMVALVTNPKVFPILSGYVDFAGLYGASQLIRGYTKSYYARVEDIESKVDLMIRGHLQKQYGKDTVFASALINCYVKRNCSQAMRSIYDQDPLLKSMLELLRTVMSIRKPVYSSIVKSYEKMLDGGKDG